MSGGAVATRDATGDSMVDVLAQPGADRAIPAVTPEVGERGGGGGAEMERRQAEAGELMRGVERGGHRLDGGVDEDEAAEPAQRPAHPGGERVEERQRRRGRPGEREAADGERGPGGERGKARPRQARRRGDGAAGVDERDQVPEAPRQAGGGERRIAKLDGARQRPGEAERHGGAEQRQLGGQEPGQGQRGGADEEGQPARAGARAEHGQRHERERIDGEGQGDPHAAIIAGATRDVGDAAPAAPGAGGRAAVDGEGRRQGRRGAKTIVASGVTRAIPRRGLGGIGLVWARSYG